MIYIYLKHLRAKNDTKCETRDLYLYLKHFRRMGNDTRIGDLNIQYLHESLRMRNDSSVLMIAETIRYITSLYDGWQHQAMNTNVCCNSAVQRKHML